MTKYIGWIVMLGWVLVVLAAISTVMYWCGMGPKPLEISTSVLLICLLLILEKMDEKQQK